MPDQLFHPAAESLELTEIIPEISMDFHQRRYFPITPRFMQQKPDYLLIQITRLHSEIFLKR